MQNSNPIIGETIGGRYRIIKHLGNGAFGQTYQAIDTQRPGKPRCAVKHLKPLMANLQMARGRFDTEAAILERLGKHDRIPRLLAHFEENQEFYLVQEFIEGEDLSKELLPGKQFGEEEVVILLRDILEVLEVVHKQGVIHRDLKPPNIMRRQDGRIVLIDFGAVKQISTSAINAGGQAQPTVAIGTLGYMPPEQAQGRPRPCSDIYAVGAIAIQALVGESPINLEDLNSGQIIWRDRIEVSPRLGEVLDKMICPNLSDRYQSATEVLQALHDLMPATTFPQPQPPSTAPTRVAQTGNPTKPDWTVVFALFGLILFCLAVAIALPKIKQALEDSPPSPSPSPVATLEPLDFLTYENSNYGFKIKYPQNWKVQAIDDPITGEVAKFLPPSKSELFGLAAQVVVKIEDLEPISLTEYAKSSIEEIRQFLPGAIILDDNRKATLGDRPAYELTYKGVQDGIAVQKMEVATLWQYKAHVLTYEAEAGDYSNWEPTARQIVDSFELLARED